MVDRHRKGGGLSSRHVDLETRWCISVPEAAKMLGISRNFAYELVRQHQLPVVEFGKRKLILKVALQKRLEQGVNNEGSH